MRRLAVVILVDARGHVLLQERDEHAPMSPEKWGMVGGHVEDGEDFEPAAYRELEEETGVRLDGGLRLWRDEEFGYSDQDQPFHFTVWVAADLGSPTPTSWSARADRSSSWRRTTVPGLDPSESCRHFVTGFLASQTYADLLGSLPR